MMNKRSFSGLLFSLSHLLLLLRTSNVAALSFDYNFSSPGVLAGAELDYIGDASPMADRVNLTKPENWSSGIVASNRPLRLWDNTTTTNQRQIASFVTNFTINISPINNTAQGDGMAFFIRPYPAIMPPDSQGGFLGFITNPYNESNADIKTPTVGVEFDTYQNTWDPKTAGGPHIGINVMAISSAAYVPAPGIRGTMLASVRYDAPSSMLDVTVWFNDRPGVTSRSLTNKVDLIEIGLPQEVAVGFSAATGILNELHQVLSWSFDSKFSIVTDGTSRKRKERTGTVIAGVALAGTFLVLSLASFLCYLKHSSRRKRTAAANPPQDDDELMEGAFEKGTMVPRRFSYGELSVATWGFSDEHNKLGEGGFGSVYRGFLKEQRLAVAIKRVSKTSRQGRREYVSEVTVITQLRHRNLVQLLGWCHEADELLLVYELMANGSLDTHLYSSTNVLSWTVRYQAMLSTGSALLYLHEECEKCVLHRDIKPSNVLLDSSFKAKLGDFGLARLVDRSRTDGQRTTGLAGTLGYMDPECAVTSRASTESDVYSFGVVLLEVACARRPISPADLEEGGEEDERLVDRVWRLYGSGRVLDAADPRLSGSNEFDEREMERALVVGLWCAHPDGGCRPSIRQALSALQFEAPLPVLPREMPVPLYYAHHRQLHGGGCGSGTSTTTASSTGSHENHKTTASFGRSRTGVSSEFSTPR